MSAPEAYEDHSKSSQLRACVGRDQRASWKEQTERETHDRNWVVRIQRGDEIVRCLSGVQGVARTIGLVGSVPEQEVLPTLDEVDLLRD